MAELWTYELDAKTHMAKLKKITPDGESVMAYLHVTEHNATRFMENLVLVPQATARIAELEKKLKDCQSYSASLVARLEEENLL